MEFMHSVIVIKVSDRRKNAKNILKILTGFGSIINTRVGFNKGDEEGIIILNLEGGGQAIREFKEKLSKEKGVEVKDISFD